MYENVLQGLGKSNVDHEFILVEDGSKDETKKIIKELETSYPIINLGQDERRGYSKAVVDGIFSSKKKFILCTDSDNQIKVDSLIKNLNGKNIKEKKFYNFEIPIFWGGPLDGDKIFILHSKDYKNKKTKEYNKISISNDRKTLIDIAEKKGPKNYLIINGLSAWTVGQLDGEIERRHWNLSEINEDIIFEKNNKKKFILATKNSFIQL